MKKRYLTIAFLFGVLSANAQVGIGTLVPNKSAELIIESSNRGLLIPQVALTSTKDTTTITNGNVESLLVYASKKQNDISEGYYYWHNDSWVRLVTELKHTADMINQIKEIVNVEGGNVFYNNGEITYKDSNGAFHVLDLEKYVKETETVTTLIDNTDGTFTYTSEDGSSVIINVPSSVVNNFKEIIKNDNVKNEIVNLIEVHGGNVYYDGTTFEYQDTNGDKQIIDIKEIVTSNETVTTLVDNLDGTYTYTSENGTEIIINVPESVVNNFKEIIENEDVKNEIVNLIEVHGGNVYYDGTTFEHQDTNGDKHIIDIKGIVTSNETVTTIVDNKDGTYTYTSENDTEIIINVPESVVNNFKEIIENEDVKNEIVNLIEVHGGNVYYDGTTFEYQDTNGDKHIINIKDIVTSNETITTLVHNIDDTYTYISENSTETKIDIPAAATKVVKEIIKTDLPGYRNTQVIASFSSDIKVGYTQRQMAATENTNSNLWNTSGAVQDIIRTSFTTTNSNPWDTKHLILNLAIASDIITNSGGQLDTEVMAEVHYVVNINGEDVATLTTADFLLYGGASRGNHSLSKGVFYISSKFIKSNAENTLVIKAKPKYSTFNLAKGDKGTNIMNSGIAVTFKNSGSFIQLFER